MGGGSATPAAQSESTTEEALLKQALAMSMGGEATETTETKDTPPAMPDFSQMSEDEQIAYAMRMSMQDAQGQAGKDKEQSKKADDKDEDEAMEVDEPKKEGDADYSLVMEDHEFIQSVLESLPGVDPQSVDLKSAIGSLQKKDQDKDKDKEKDKKDEEKK